MESFSCVAAVRPARTRQGFTLVVTLTILAAVTILVVGLFGIVGRERQVSGTYDSVDQADLAVQAGLEDASSLLKQALADELGVIFAAPLTPEVDAQGRRREVLVAGRYDVTSQAWQYQALASGAAAPPSSERLVQPAPGFELLPSSWVTNPDKKFLDPAKEGGRLPRAAPWLAAKPKFWMDVKLPGDQSRASQTEEKVVARYCFEVDDVQGRLSLASAGMHDTQPTRDNPARQEALALDVPMSASPVVPGLTIDVGGRWRRQPSQVWTLLEPQWEWLPKSMETDAWPVEPSGTLTDSKAMHRLLTSMDAKRLYLTHESWKELLMTRDTLRHWPGMNQEAFTARYTSKGDRPPGLPAGSLIDPQLRALEENTTGVWAGYDERALVPHDAGFAFGGEPKLNLNELLMEAQAHTEKTNVPKAREVVEKIADHMDRHLPDFRKRAGGYTLPRASPISDRPVHEKAYLKALAAGMVDYVDRDGMPTMNIDQGGAGKEDGPGSESLIEYRGMDAIPLVNELWQRHRYERLITSSKVEYSLTDYVELWNMTNQEVIGEVLLSFEYRGRFLVGSEVYPVMSTAQSNRVVRGKPVKVDGLEGLWLKPEPQKYGSRGETPSGTVTLKPNEITVLRCPPVVFHLDGSGIETITGVQYFGQPAYGNDERQSRYRLAFRPVGSSEYTIVDLPFATLERYQRTSTASTRQVWNVNQCGLSYRLRDKNWAFNVGDTRGAFYIDYHQEVIDYVNGSSPWGRNYRRFDRMAGEVRTFLWPDGGHNSVPSPQRIGDMNHNPVDGPAPMVGSDIAAKTRPQLNAGNNATERLKYVQHLSSLGRFYSMTELGHIFDPVMWNPNGNSWGDVEVLYGQHADIGADVFDKNPGASLLDAHKRFCGGNTLRVGRVEHSAFRPDYRQGGEQDPTRPTDRGMSASSLLDLFHCGNANAPTVDGTIGNLVRIDGHVNINTATQEVLRALIAGRLEMDPLLVANSQKDPDRPTKKLGVDEQGRGNPDPSKPKVLVPASVSPEEKLADLMAEAIIRNRPYVTPAEVAEKAIITEPMRSKLTQYEALTQNRKDLVTPVAMGLPVFGYTKRADPKGASIEEDRVVSPQWNDRAAEEAFARLWNNATTRSRHFLVTVTGQAVKVSRSGDENVLATRSRQFQVFVRPVRDGEGNLIQQVVEVTHSQSF